MSSNSPYHLTVLEKVSDVVSTRPGIFYKHMLIKTGVFACRVSQWFALETCGCVAVRILGGLSVPRKGGEDFPKLLSRRWVYNLLPFIGIERYYFFHQGKICLYIFIFKMSWKIYFYTIIIVIMHGLWTLLFFTFVSLEIVHKD